MRAKTISVSPMKINLKVPVVLTDIRQPNKLGDICHFAKYSSKQNIFKREVSEASFLSLVKNFLRSFTAHSSTRSEVF